MEPRDDVRCSWSSRLPTIYVGTIEAAFSALMRLSLRLTVERNGRAAGLGPYLDDPGAAVRAGRACCSA